MAKMALCMQRSNLFRLVPHPESWGLQPITPGALMDTGGDWLGLTMQDRATCESDESLLQLIPYIALVDDVGRFFCYSRGAASGEDRLKTKLSIGLGGHVDTFPASGQSLLDLLRREGERELREEVGLDIVLGSPASAIIRDVTAVDRVHLGILFVVNVAANWEPVLEAGHIEPVGFMRRHDLRQKDVFDRLEGWSQIVVDCF